MAGAIVLGWFTFAALIFSRSEGWPFAQSFFYAVDSGMSIGFGAVSEQRTATKLFTMFNVLLGASAVGGALALFAEGVVRDASNLAAEEFSSAALSAAFARADANGDGQLDSDEFERALRQLKLTLSDAELRSAFERFDVEGDGRISHAEFEAAVRPHLRGTSTVEQAVRSAAAARAETPLERALRVAGSALSEHRIFALWLVWVGAGAVWAATVEGWGLVQSLYFAVCGLSTSGLQAPSVADGVLPNRSALFVALFCMSGVPIFGFALGRFADVFVRRLVAAREREALSRPLSADEFDFSRRLFTPASTPDDAGAADSETVDFGEYLALEMIRLGKADMGTLELIKAEFDRLDADGSGTLSRAEAQQAKRLTA